MEIFRHAEDLHKRLTEVGYVTESSLVAAVFLAIELKRPLLLEGETGVGKTQVGKALAQALRCPLIRLQCYEGLDINTTVYEWNYKRQLLALKVLNNEITSVEASEQHIFSQRYLLKRPLLDAITRKEPPVLLIDEVDRADEEFEAYLLELLSDFQISIPEMGTIKAVTKPWVVLTSNATRELSDALRRRCLYHYLDYPSFDKEMRILKTLIPDMSVNMTRQVVGFIQSLRGCDMQKRPGVAESLDWAAALVRLEVSSLEDSMSEIISSLSCLVKTKEDMDMLTQEEVKRLVASAV